MIKIINCNSKNYKKKLISLLEKRRSDKENVSKILENAIRGFLKEGPLP